MIAAKPALKKIPLTSAFVAGGSDSAQLQPTEAVPSRTPAFRVRWLVSVSPLIEGADYREWSSRGWFGWRRINAGDASRNCLSPGAREFPIRARQGVIDRGCNLAAGACHDRTEGGRRIAARTCLGFAKVRLRRSIGRDGQCDPGQSGEQNAGRDDAGENGHDVPGICAGMCRHAELYKRRYTRSRRCCRKDKDLASEPRSFEREGGRKRRGPSCPQMCTNPS